MARTTPLLVVGSWGRFLVFTARVASDTSPRPCKLNPGGVSSWEKFILLLVVIL